MRVLRDNFDAIEVEIFLVDEVGKDPEVRRAVVVKVDLFALSLDVRS